MFNDDKQTKKTLTAVGAVALAAVVGLGGTFAWQSISQQALNEAAAVVNPGGRLHDDFDGRNKDVYVENFTDAEDGTAIFARVRLDEYMELGVDAGQNQEADDRNADPVVAGTSISDKTTWITRTPDSSNPFTQYWVWDTEGGQTVYMPTFNKNKDSLKADINGSYEGTGSGTPYDDYQTYTEGQEVTADATYDNDSNDIEDENVRVEEETHIAARTIDGTVITMDEWLTRWEAYQTAVEGGTDPETAAADTQVKGDFWVWDADGWAYWANPIEPGTATGLLLDGIELVNPPSDNYYYGINVVGQFVTADDIGHLNGTGFYDRSEGRVPSSGAEDLLELITGTVIEVPPTEGEMDSSVSDEIRDAVAIGHQYEIVTIDDTEWYVLAVDYDTDRALIFSRYVLEDRAYDAAGDVYWKDSDLRTYLNGEWLSGQDALYNAAVETTLYDIDKEGVLSTTQDKVFLLSQADIYGAGAATDPRLATYYEWEGTGEGQGDVLPKVLQEATTKDGVETDWWTRSYEPAEGQVPVTQIQTVSDTGTSSTASPDAADVGVRPAMWIQLDTDKEPVPSDTLDFETSAAVRDAEIQDMDQAADNYDTVMIDGVEWYVLKVQGDKALLLSKYVHPQSFNFIPSQKRVDEEQIQRFFPNADKAMAGRSYDAIWATSDVHDYLNGEWLSMHPTLNAVAAETSLQTRFYLADAERTEYWCESNDKVFLLSEADVYGTTFDVSSDTYDETNTMAAKEQEYTLGTAGVLLPETLRTAAVIDNADFEQEWFLRTSRHHSVMGQSYMPGIAAVDGSGELDGTNIGLVQYLRPAMWVKLNPTTASIAVTPPAEVVEYNGSVELPVSISVNDSPVSSPAVVWTIRGATSADTRMEGNTLHIGADEQNTRLQVIASYAVGGQTITDTIYVTVNPAPARLNAEDSAKLRKADASKLGLNQPAEAYDVVKIDGVDFYVLAVDEENDLALIFAKDIVGKDRLGNSSSSADWDNSYGAKYYLNNDWLNDQPTLKEVAEEKNISFYTLADAYSLLKLENCTNKVFAPSYADVTGLKAADQESPAEVPGEYTYGSGQLIPTSLRTAEGGQWLLRTASIYELPFPPYDERVAVYTVNEEQIMNDASPTTSYGLRPMLWVRIAAE